MIAVEVRQWRRLADGSNRGSSCISSDSFSGTSSDIMNKRGGGRAGGGRPGAEHPLCPESGATRESNQSKVQEPSGSATNAADAATVT